MEETARYDFWGETLNVGDEVVCLVYSKTSASLERGMISKLNDKTAMVTMLRKERRFDYSKLVKIKD